MVEVSAKVVITGMICLTVIYMTLLLCNKEDSTIGITIVGVISLAIGVIIPAPKVDTKKGVLKW